MLLESPNLILSDIKESDRIESARFFLENSELGNCLVFSLNSENLKNLLLKNEVKIPESVKFLNFSEKISEEDLDQVNQVLMFDYDQCAISTALELKEVLFPFLHNRQIKMLMVQQPVYLDKLCYRVFSSMAHDPRIGIMCKEYSKHIMFTSRPQHSRRVLIDMFELLFKYYPEFPVPLKNILV